MVFIPIRHDHARQSIHRHSRGRQAILHRSPPSTWFDQQDVHKGGVETKVRSNSTRNDWHTGLEEASLDQLPVCSSLFWFKRAIRTGLVFVVELQPVALLTFELSPGPSDARDYLRTYDFVRCSKSAAMNRTCLLANPGSTSYLLYITLYACLHKHSTRLTATASCNVMSISAPARISTSVITSSFQLQVEFEIYRDGYKGGQAPLSSSLHSLSISSRQSPLTVLHSQSFKHSITVA